MTFSRLRQKLFFLEPLLIVSFGSMGETWLAAARIKSCETNSYKDDPIRVWISLPSIAIGNIHTLSV